MAKSKLAALREKYGFTQPELAKLIFVEQSTISKYESVKRKMNDEIIKRVTDALGADLNETKELKEEQGGNNFENGNMVNGNDVVNAQQYYHVPKQMLDSIIQQQVIIINMLQVLSEKSK